MAATRGPIPKRSDQRRRRNKAESEVDQAPAGTSGRGPDLGIDAHPLAADWYESLRRSGQSVYFEESDWAQARILTEALSRVLYSDKAPNGQFLASWFSAAGELLTTEGARRRMRLELQRDTSGDEDEDAAVSMLDEYRKRVSG